MKETDLSELNPGADHTEFEGIAGALTLRDGSGRCGTRWTLLHLTLFSNHWSDFSEYYAPVAAGDFIRRSKEIKRHLLTKSVTTPEE